MSVAARRAKLSGPEGSGLPGEILVCGGRRPENLRSDNGPEFVARRVQQRAESGRIGLSYIQPGSPWEDGNVESFHASLRAELLDREFFFSVAEAMLGSWNTKSRMTA